MPVTIAVLVAAVLAAAAIWALSRSPAMPDPVDPAAEERWLVRLVAHHPRLGAARQEDRPRRRRRADARRRPGDRVRHGLGRRHRVRHGRPRTAVWPAGTRPWPTGAVSNASTWSTNVLDALTDLGGTAILVVVVDRRRGVRLLASSQRQRRAVPRRGPRRRGAAQQRAEADRRPRATRRPAPRRDGRLVVPVRALDRPRLRRGSPSPSSSPATGRGAGGPSPPLPPRRSSSPWRRRAPCSACTGSPTSWPACWSAGAGSCSAPSRSAGGCSGSVSRPSGPPTLQRRLRRQGEDRAAVVVGLGPLEDHPSADARPSSTRQTWLAKNGPSSTSQRVRSRWAPAERRRIRPSSTAGAGETGLDHAALPCRQHVADR